MAVKFDRVDLDFILRQILMAEAGQPPVNPHLAFGLREVGGTNNNVVPGDSVFGAADQPLSLFAPNDQVFLSQYIPGTQFVFDSTPRTISNLIADQTSNNPAAVDAFVAAGLGIMVTVTTGTTSTTVLHYLNADGTTGAVVPPNTILEIPNVTPDGGISAPFNTWFTLFGQFFDHGVDLITKSSAGPAQELIFITLNSDDPLFNPAPGAPNFMVVARAVDPTPNATTPNNLVTPFVDNSQTYTSHASHQAFLREYSGGVSAAGVVTGTLHSTGRLLDHVNADGSHNLATWGDLKANAKKLGFILTDYDVGNVPLLATDAYGNLILGANGLAQVVVQLPGGGQRLVEGAAAGLDLTNPIADAGVGGVTGEAVLRIGHAFINDMARAAAPFDDFGNQKAAGTYDSALLGNHFVGGDGRLNENFGLTAIHDIFEKEHNRLVDQTKALVLAELAKGDTSFAEGWVVAGANLADGIQASEWNGERLFQAAKFGTETQYQHLVFEEFARKVAPTIHVATNTNLHLDAAITSEFANAVYRFGHSMLNETLQVQAIDPATGKPAVDAQGNPVYTQDGLLTAFTNPLGFATAGGATGIVQGTTNQIGNEIDEFVTGTLRNKLLGQPLDLAAINIARGRDTGVPPLNEFRNEVYQQTHDANLRPYVSWDDFRHYLKHDASIINFVAAYGTHATITGVTDAAAKRTAALALVKNGEIGSATFNQDAYDFMHSRGAYANVDTTRAGFIDDPRLMHGSVVHKPFLAADGTETTTLQPGGHANPLAGTAVAQWNTGSITGLDQVDMWIGGLAEKQALNGGLLGSTFELIFRVQLENLQDGDRLYYLPRIEGTHFSDEIENNTFAELIQADTNAHHLGAAIFMTPEYNIEAKDYYKTKLAADGVTTIFDLDASGHVQYDDAKIAAFNTAYNAANPPAAGQPPLTMLEVTAKGELHFNGVDYFFGNTIVMGGTDQADKLLSGNADDDTVWGDGGNDTIDGGGGNDNLFGGAGDDLITDQAGANVVHGDDGNDTILMGKGDDAINGGDGNDYIEAGGGMDGVNGGAGNDIIKGGEGADEILGDQGDDWIEGGNDGGDNLVGDVGAPTGQLPLYTGNDVLIGGVGTVMKGFGGDDIMLGRGGFDKFIGGTGFDWASFERETEGVSVDMKRREFVSPLNPLAGDGVRDVFTHTEGLSGSKFNDDIRGEDTAVAARILAKDELTNASLVHGLNDLRFAGPDGRLNNADDVFTTTTNGGTTVEGNFFAQGPVSFAAGDILLGGGGSDRIQGGGGNDMIDGDAFLHVDLAANALGVIGAGSQIIREIRYADKTVADAQAVDTAVYQDVAADYVINVHTINNGVVAAATTTLRGDQLQTALDRGRAVLALDAQGFATIKHNVPIVNGGNAAVLPKVIDEGTDLFRNIERLEFSDLTVDISSWKGAAFQNHLPGGALTITGAAAAAPNVGDTLSATSTITDVDGPIGPITYQWQYQDLLRAEWINITGASAVGGAAPPSFTPGAFEDGHAIRLKATYLDARGFVETVTTAATPLLGSDQSKNFGPTQLQRVPDYIPDTSAYQGESVNIFVPITNFWIDDHTASNALTYRAFIVDAAGTQHEITSNAHEAGQALTFTVLGGAGAVTGATITGTLPAGINGQITVRFTANDNGFTTPVGGIVLPALTSTADFHIDVLNATGPAPAATTLSQLPASPAVGLHGAHFDRVDLDYILTQIKMAEAGQPPVNPHLAFGLHTVSAEDNSALGGQGTFGQSDQPFPRLSTPVFGMAQADPGTLFGPSNGQLTNYGQTSGFVFDSDPRMISNLISDQSDNNVAAKAAALDQSTVMPAVQDPNKVAGTDGTDPGNGLTNYFIPSVTPDGGISAPNNTFMALFGQFFDHGLDLVNKGGNGTVIVPLRADDPLIAGKDHILGNADDLPANLRFMALTRGTLIPGTHETTNAVTPPVDLSQVYSSHPSHQVFLREYVMGSDGLLHATGKMLTSTAADGSHHLPTWLDIKLNAARLGINLQDKDVFSVPMLRTDDYGNLVLDNNGHVQMVKVVGGVNTFVPAGTVNMNVTVAQLHAGTIPGLVDTTGSVGAGVQFINDMAPGANPTPGPGQPAFNQAILEAHYAAGDGRVNENIGLTSIHDIMMSEHNRLLQQTKDYVQQMLNAGDTSAASEWVLAGTSLANNADGSVHRIAASEWNGERLFQAARFGAETQYQHLVFGEFARKIAPDIHVAGDTNIHLDPAVLAEFAHTVYRFGHSMLDENLQRFSVQKAFLNPDGTTTDTAGPNTVVNEKVGTPELGLAFIDATTGKPTNLSNNGANAANLLAGVQVLLDPTTGKQVSSDIALLTAFTNPLAYLNAGHDAAGQLVTGAMDQVGNEIDEFVTGTLRNNLLGLPLDLAALNIARGRSEGVAGLNLVRAEIFDQNHDSLLKPYDSWHEFGQFLKHPESLINFVAAYGTESNIANATTAAAKRAAAGLIVAAGQDDANKGSAVALAGTSITKGDAWDFMHGTGLWAHNVNDIRAAHSIVLNADGTPQSDPTSATGLKMIPAQWGTGDITGLDRVDLWIGGLAEKQNLHDSMLGSTFDVIFKVQMETLQDADRLYYLPRIEGTHFSDQIENSSFAEIIINNTGVKHISGSVFLTPEYTIEADKYYLHDATGHVLEDVNGNYVYDPNVPMPTFTGADGAQHALMEILGGRVVAAAGELAGDGTTVLAAGTIVGGTLHFLGEDNFFGNTMVLGGTDGNDNLMAGQADDDTIWGDAGNDTLDGGGGNDIIYGGDGNDLLSNSNSSIGSVFHGDAGDDTIYGGKGDDAIFGGDGNDVIYGGQGVDDLLGGNGNDIIYGGEGGEEIQGDGGDDWIDGGPDGGDVLFGDVGAPTGGFPLYEGNDVMIGHNGSVMKGFNGDDIMVGDGGFTKFDGGLGYDWASFEISSQGVSVDMNRKEFIAANNPVGADGIRDLYQLTEALSGSKFSDDILGDNKARAVIGRNSLDNPTLIKGLADASNATVVAGGTTTGNFFFPGLDTATAFGGPGATGGFAGGNILLGGAGDDAITGGNGNDIIDGDAWLHVELLPVTLPNGTQGIGTGSQILREIRYDITAGNVDTARFSGTRSEYTIRGADNLGFITVIDNNVPPVVPVAGVRATNDGTDRIRNIERIQFADGTFTIDKLGNLFDGNNNLVQGVGGGGGGPGPGGGGGGGVGFPAGANHLSLLNGAPIVHDVTLTLTTPGVAVAGTPEVSKAVNVVGFVPGGPVVTNLGITDLDFGPTGVITNLNGSAVANGAISDRIHIQWQYLDIAQGQWVPILDPRDSNPLLPSNGATSPSFTPTNFQLGNQLRAVLSYKDALGFTETIASAPTAVLIPDPLAANSSPFVEFQKELVGFGNTSAQQDNPINGMFLPLLEVFNDRETAASALTYKAAIVTADGVAHDITATMNAAGVVTPVAGASTFMGLNFIVDKDGTGAVTDGHIVGTPPNGFSGAITVRITATDAGTGAAGANKLSVTNEFNIDVLPAGGNLPPQFNPAVFTQPNFDENVAAIAAVDGVAHNTPAGKAVANLSAFDVLAAGQVATSLTWSITNAANLPTNLFALDAPTPGRVGNLVTSTDVLRFASAPDFEAIKKFITAGNTDVTIDGTGKEITIKVQVQVSDGALTSTQTETILIENVNEKAAGTIAINNPVVNGGNGGNSVTLTATDNIADPDLITAANANGLLTGNLANSNGSATPFQWQIWTPPAGATPGSWTNFAATASLSNVTGRTLRATASYTDAFGTHDATTEPALTVAPPVIVIGTTGSDTVLSGAAPAGLFANGTHDRTFFGLSGTDTVTYATDTLGVTADLTNAANNTGIAAGDKYNSIENYIGGSGNDTFVAAVNAVANRFDGGGGVNTLNLSAATAGFTANMVTGAVTGGNLGNDTFTNIQNIIGGTSNDTFRAAADNAINTFDGGGGTNTYDLSAITLAAGAPGFTVNLATHQATGGALGIDTLLNIQNVTGSTGNDTFIAVVDDVRNVFVGGTGVDTADYSAYAANLTVNLSTAGFVVTGSGTTTGTSDTLSGFENFTGGAGNDTITGDGNANVLIGGAGVDTINGGASADVITGGAGSDVLNSGAADDNVADVFVFTATGDYGDTIANFDATGTTAQVDKVRLIGALNTAFDDIANDDVFQFVSGNGGAGTVAANISTTAEALYLSGATGEGVANANLGSANSVAAAFNAEFVITSAVGDDALLVINDTNSNSASVWQYVENGGAGIQATELTRIATINANATILTSNFELL
jgi:Ca2+-binding RTX toxin-like protein